MNIGKLQDIKLIHRNPLHSYKITLKKIERQIKETISFIIAIKKIKYLVINLPKETKGPYIENHKTVMKKSNMTKIDGEMYHVCELEKLI